MKVHFVICLTFCPAHRSPRIPKSAFLRLSTLCSAHRSPRIPESAFFPRARAKGSCCVGLPLESSCLSRRRCHRVAAAERHRPAAVGRRWRAAASEPARKMLQRSGMPDKGRSTSHGTSHGAPHGTSRGTSHGTSHPMGRPIGIAAGGPMGLLWDVPRDVPQDVLWEFPWDVPWHVPWNVPRE